MDALQALHLAMSCASAVLESAKQRLAWLGKQGDLGMPKFLPELPKPRHDRLEAIVDREPTKFWRRVQGSQRLKPSKVSSGRRRPKSA